MIAAATASGFATGFSLILAIGAQNAFVLRQGLRGEHVLAVCLACALSDAVLIGAGVAGFGALSASMPWLVGLMRIAGALFLLAYGARALWAAWTGAQIGLTPQGQGQARPGLLPVLATTLALTWLNPHVYLDTLMVIGAVSTGFGPLRWAFGAGAVAASFVFFFGLGYGARLARPLFARPAVWRWLDAGIGLVMWGIALMLISGV